MNPDQNPELSIAPEAQALTETGSVPVGIAVLPRELRKIVAALFLANLTAEMGLGIIMPMLPIFARNIGATGASLGLIFGAYQLGRLLFIPVVVKLDNYIDRRRFILAGLLMFVISSAGFLLAKTVSLLILMRLLQGIGGAVIITISMSALGDLAPSHAEGRIMGILQFALWGGFGVGPILGGALTDWAGIAFCFIATAGLGALALVFSILIMPNIEGPKRGKRVATWGYRPLLSARSMIGLIILNCSFAFTRGMTSAFLPLFADQILYLSGTAIGAALTVNLLLIGLIQWPAGKLADQGNRVFISSVSFTMAGGTLFALTWAGDFWQMGGIFIANALFTGCAIPAMYALAVEEGREHGMAQAMSAMSMVNNIGYIAGALAGGIFVDTIGLQLLFAFGPIGGWMGVAIFLRLVRR
jgi:DHA1 family multidrug resistance protein-like MFS transporter